VDNVRYPGPPPASVDVVRQPYLSSMSADIVVPQLGLQPAVGVDGASSIVGPRWLMLFTSLGPPLRML